MKKVFVIIVLLAALTVSAGKRTPLVTNIEPPYWWTGMANDTLQVMLTGSGLSDATVSVDYPGVSVVGEPKLDSPDYRILYLRIDPSAQPGTMPIAVKRGKERQVIDYQLKARAKAGAEHTGFDASDVLYLLMPDRFAKGVNAKVKGRKGDSATALEYPVADNRDNPNARHGGNIAGIAGHLGYIDSLGVTAIWLCPVLENDMPGGSYHGYATTDYYRIDPRFGTNEQYKALIDSAHNRGLKVVMDMIFNHTGSNHPWMRNMPDADWYNHPAGDVTTNFRLTTVHDPYVSDYDLDRTVNGWFVKSMPDLNQRNEHVAKYLTQNSIWWIESTGIDGIRMDTYPYADMQAMSRWCADVLREYPNFNIVGECWYGQESGDAYWQRDSRLNPHQTNLPTVMDFFFVTDGRKALGINGGRPGTATADSVGAADMDAVYNHLTQDFMYPDPQRILTFLDNHDSDRFLAAMPDSELALDAWKQAQTLLLTSRGIPQIYYGTELLMNGGKERSDGLVRRDMPGGWPGDSIDAFTPQGRTAMQNKAWNFLSALLNWRRGEAGQVIAGGRMKHFIPQNNVYVYQRSLPDGRAVTVLMNGQDKAVTVDMTPYAEILPQGSQWTGSLTGTPVVVGEAVTLAPRQTLLLQNF